jgi:D-amino-acid dehydrogenase
MPVAGEHWPGEHCSGEYGPADPDVLVIGAGIVGLFCAYFLRRAGASVTVVERGPAGGPQSCSYGNTGFVGTQGSVPLAEPGVPAQGLRWLLNPRSPFYIKPRLDPELARWLWHFRRACNERDAAAGFGVLLDLKQRSLAILREICGQNELRGAGQPGSQLSPGAPRDPGLDRLAAAFRADGLLVTFRSPAAFDKARASLPHLTGSGIPIRELAPGELDALEPGAEFDVCGALLNEEGAALAVPDFLAGLAGLLAGQGVRICEHTEVTGFEVAGTAGGGRRIERVRTTAGTLRPGHTVLAAGSWSVRCARQLDLGLRLQPAKGYSITVATPPGAPSRPVLLSEGKVALTPLGDRLRIAGTLELSGLDRSVSAGRLAGIRQTVSAYLPRMAPSPTLETWCGLRPCTPDGLPFLGPAEGYRNLAVACGHGHVGMGLAPASGRLIAQVIAGEQPDVDLTPLRPGRYRRRAGGARSYRGSQR